MIFAAHNYYSNFCNATGADDSAMQRDMVLTEITKIIADDSQAIITALTTAGLPIPKCKTTPVVAVDMFILNMGNANFQKELAKLILKNNKIELDAQLKQPEQNNSMPVGRNANELLNKTNPAPTGQLISLTTLDATASVIDSIAKATVTNDDKKKLKLYILSGINTAPAKTKINFGKIILWGAIIGLAVYALKSPKSSAA